jgi:acetyl esterase/lipase
MGFHRQHWKMISYLAGELGCSVTAPDYPLAPAGHVDDVFDMVLPLYREIANEAGASNVCIMGDSAGGGLALALAQRIREEGLEQPARIILLAPWLDVSLSNPDIAAIDQIDPCLNVEGLREVGREYAGTIGTEHYLVSPINGSLAGLATVTLFVGTHDILLADCRSLKAKAAREGLVLEYHEIEGLVHPGILMSLPEAVEIRREIVHILGG